MHLNVSSAKWRPFCFGSYVLNISGQHSHILQNVSSSHKSEMVYKILLMKLIHMKSLSKICRHPRLIQLNHKIDYVIEKYIGSENKFTQSTKIFIEYYIILVGQKIFIWDIMVIHPTNYRNLLLTFSKHCRRVTCAAVKIHNMSHPGYRYWW